MTYQWLAIKGCQLYLGYLPDGKPVLLGYVVSSNQVTYLFTAYLVGGRHDPAIPLLSEQRHPGGASLFLAQQTVEDAVAAELERARRAGGAL